MQTEIDSSKIQLTTAPTKEELAARNWDKYGTLAGTLCTIKCTGLPVIAAIAPSLSGTLASLSHNPVAHWGFLALTAPGAYSLAMKEPKERFTYAVGASAVGFSAMLTGAIGHQFAHSASASGHDHSAHMGDASMDHSAHMDHSQHNHGTAGTSAMPAQLPKSPDEIVMDVSHYAFLFGTLAVLSGHLSRLNVGIKILKLLKVTQ